MLAPRGGLTEEAVHRGGGIGRLLACAIVPPRARDLYSQTIGRFRLPGGTFAPRSNRGPIRQIGPTEKAKVLR